LGAQKYLYLEGAAPNAPHGYGPGIDSYFICSFIHALFYWSACLASSGKAYHRADGFSICQ